MNFKYVRIQGQELAENTMYAKGVFSMCWQLIQNDVMDEERMQAFSGRSMPGSPRICRGRRSAKTRKRSSASLKQRIPKR